MKRKIGFLSIISILMLAGCTNEGFTGNVVSEESKEKIIFGVAIDTMASAPIFVAETKEFWEEEEMEVEIKPFLSGRLALDALLGKAVGAATVADFSTVLAAFQKQDVKIIATISTSEEHVNILARRDKGILNPQDLSGKKIAMSFGTSGEYVLNRFLEANNISKTDVKIVNLNPPDMIAAITKGDVDAIVTWQPNIHNAKNILGNNAILFSSKGIYKHPFNVVVLGESLDEQKDAQRKLLSGLKKAEKFMRENRKESIEIVAKRLGMDSKDVEMIWDGYSFKIGIEPDFAKSLENEGKWAKKAGIVNQEEPDYGALVYDEYVNALK